MPQAEKGVRGKGRSPCPRPSTQKPRSANSAPDTIISACAIDQER